MEASKKADELYYYYEKIFVDANADSWGKEAKQCAIKTVAEILSAHFMKRDSGYKTFWLNVLSCLESKIV
jgi:hypothetical protein